MKKIKIGLALGGGGARGFAHVGVLKAFEEAEFNIKSLAGISMGAVVGAGYAHKRDLKKLEKYVLDLKYLEFVKSHRKSILMDINNIVKYFDEYLDSCHFKDLQVPLKVLTTDLKEMRSFVIHEGKVSVAITASSTTPYIHKPLRYKGRLLVDGGLLTDVPVELINDEDLDIIVGVNVASHFKIEEDDVMHLNNFQKSIISKFPPLALLWQKQINTYMKHSKRVVNNELANLRLSLLKKPLIMIKPNLKDMTVLSFDRAEEAIQAGYIEAQKVIKQIRKQPYIQLQNQVDLKSRSISL